MLARPHQSIYMINVGTAELICTHITQHLPHSSGFLKCFCLPSSLTFYFSLEIVGGNF